MQVGHWCTTAEKGFCEKVHRQVRRELWRKETYFCTLILDISFFFRDERVCIFVGVSTQFMVVCGNCIANKDVAKNLTLSSKKLPFPLPFLEFLG